LKWIQEEDDDVNIIFYDNFIPQLFYLLSNFIFKSTKKKME